jgi:N-acetyl-anhydromuramyl-L-alanine amidase AmpD
MIRQAGAAADDEQRRSYAVVPSSSSMLAIVQTPVSASTVVVNVEPTDLSPEQFYDVQAGAGSPATHEADNAYAHLASMHVSIAFLLAIFHHESTYATNPDAIVVKYQTNNPGNCRSSRTADYPIVETERGEFVDYPHWTAGWVDLSYRLTDPSYVYVQEGRRTIQQIIERFAPASDGNAPASYVNAVVTDMNRWLETGAMTAEIPGWLWTPESCGEIGYDPPGSHGRQNTTIDRLILHCTLGTNSESWLNGCHGNSTHFLDWRDGSKRLQSVSMLDAAWAAGNKGYNLRGIQYEHECTESEMLDATYWTLSILRRMATNCAEILHANPGIKPDRQHVIGHVDVPDQDHYDPGPVFPWNIFIDELAAAYSAGSDVVYRYFPETGYGVGHGFLDYWEQFHHDATSIANFGYPLSEEQDDPVTGYVIQYFERAIFEFHPENADPYRVLLRRLGADALAAAGL